MAIVKAPKNIRITVPRHNAQVIGAKLDTAIQKQAKEKRKRIDTTQPNAELVQAIESASEWNSLLTTARAERGPQWDIGTQQFLVEEFSDLYYDPTPLLETVKRLTEDERGPQKPEPPQQQPPPPQHHREPHYQGRNQTPGRDRDFQPQMGGHGMEHPGHGRHPGPPGGGNYGYPGAPNMMRGPSGQFVSGGGPQPFNPMAQQSYFGGNPPSPMRMGSIGGMSMESQGLGGHPGMGGGMGMGGGGMPGGSPAMGRRMTRNMAEDFSMN